MTRMQPRMGSLLVWGLSLCLLSSALTSLATSRLQARTPPSQRGNVRVVFVSAPTLKTPDRGPNVAASQAQLRTLEWTDSVDGATFARQIEAAAAALASEGYSIVAITPILRGESRTQERQGGATDVGVGGLPTIIGGFGTGWGAGYSVTDGVLVVGERQ